MREFIALVGRFLPEAIIATMAAAVVVGIVGFCVNFFKAIHHPTNADDD